MSRYQRRKLRTFTYRFAIRVVPYCNFTVVANRLDLVDRYVEAVSRELAGLCRPHIVDTIFIGGGTPTMLPRAAMVRLFEEIRRWIPLADGGEWSIEANPQDVTRDLCRLLRDQGINRISLGGQSFDTAKLKMLGRDHTGDQLAGSIDIASQWFEEVSVDLIFGVPGEDMHVWRSDLHNVTSRNLNHVSTYGLTYEKGARILGAAAERGHCCRRGRNRARDVSLCH